MARMRPRRPIRPSWYRDDEVEVSMSVPEGEEHRFNPDGTSKLHRPVVREKDSKEKLEVTKIEKSEEKKKPQPKVSVFDIIDLD